MAINPNTSHKNENHLYLACSGGGKSQALLHNKAIPKKGVRALLWDIDHDHRATRFESMAEFHRAVIAGIRSGAGFRIAFSGNDSVANFETFCRIAWAALDGNRTTYIYIEELADVSPASGKATPEFGRLLRKGRKFGARIHATSQRGTEISKTVYTQCPIKYIGQQEGDDIIRMSRIAGVSSEKIAALSPLQFFRKEAGPEPGQLITIRYAKP
jgi:hypothetical protein